MRRTVGRRTVIVAFNGNVTKDGRARMGVHMNQFGIITDNVENDELRPEDLAMDAEPGYYQSHLFTVGAKGFCICQGGDYVNPNVIL